MMLLRYFYLKNKNVDTGDYSSKATTSLFEDRMSLIDI